MKELLGHCGLKSAASGQMPPASAGGAILFHLMTIGSADEGRRFEPAGREAADGRRTGLWGRGFSVHDRTGARLARAVGVI